jgi:hypothetical protein
MSGGAVRRRLEGWSFILALAAVSEGCRSTGAAADEAARALAAAARVDGRVVDLWSRQPLAGRLVAIGPSRAITDAAGRFTLDGVAARYDAVVVEPDRASASVYRGLRRRDPLLVHRSIEKSERMHVADIVGTLSGGGPLETGDFVIVGFLSPEGSAIDVPSAAAAGRRPSYPGYGPVRVVWRGPDTLTGDLVALVAPGAAPDAPPGTSTERPPLLAHKTITLKTGFVTTGLPVINEDNCAAPLPQSPPRSPPTEVALALTPIKRRHVALTVEASYLESLTLSYRWPTLGAEINLPLRGPTHWRLPLGPIPVETDIPDLRELGAALCAQAVDGHGSYAETCTFPPNAPAALRPRPTPILSLPPGPRSPGGAAIFTSTTRSSWTAFAGGVHLLEIEAQFSSAEHPSVYVYTEETSATWPDLAALGVRFPEDFVDYNVGIVGFGPFASLDEALAPNGIGVATLADRYQAGGGGLFNAMLSPTGVAPEEGVCGKIESVNCDLAPKRCTHEPNCPPETPCEIVESSYPLNFTFANRMLAFHPALAAAAGMRCVRDCDGLRAFRAALKRHARAHPGFNSNEPLPASFYDALRAIPDMDRPAPNGRH